MKEIKRTLEKSIGGLQVVVQAVLHLLQLRQLLQMDQIQGGNIKISRIALVRGQMREEL